MTGGTEKRTKIYRRGIAEAATELHALREDPSNLARLLQLQAYLVARLRQSQRFIEKRRADLVALRRARSLGRPSKQVAEALKILISDYDADIKCEQSRQQAWRCFGDGVANIYQSQHSLKQLYFNTEDGTIKPHAGSFLGKDGFKLEWEVLKSAVESSVPCVLADLTNVIRHGDVCLLGRAEPFVLEVKSGTKSARAFRQVADNKKVHDFFENDFAPALRGMRNVTRVALKHEELKHLASLNSCIDKALAAGFAMIEPEPGLRYIAICHEALEGGWHELLPTGSSNMVYSLTCEEPWHTSYPYTLSLRTEDVAKFVCGELHLVVVVSAERIKEKFAELDLVATMVMDGVHAVQLNFQTEHGEACFFIIELKFARIATEFLSVDQFVQNTENMCRQGPSGDALTAGPTELTEYESALMDYSKRTRDFYS